MLKVYNIIWLILIGIFSFIIVSIIGILYTITGIGAECGQQLFRIAGYLLNPGKCDYETNFSSHKVANIIWIILFGWWLSLLYLVLTLFLVCILIGIPFATRSIKLVGLLLIPFGSDI